MPLNRRFGPLDAENTGDSTVVMSIDEYEVIRLIDLQGSR